MIETRDLGLIPEPMFSELAGPAKPFKTLYEYAQSDRYPVARLLTLAKHASLGDANAVRAYLSYLQDEHPAARYWGAYGLFLVRSSAPEVQAALKKVTENDPMAANRLMAAQALGVCGGPDEAFSVILKEADASNDGYVFLLALNAFQYSHTDDRLSLEDWRRFEQKKAVASPGIDTRGYEYATRIIADAIALWPQRRTVD